MPAIAVALVAILGGAALVLNRLWLDSARIELRTAAEAAALAAGRELANDDLLRKDFDPNTHAIKARLAAARIAAENVVAGDPLLLNTDADGDVRFGRLIIVEGGRDDDGGDGVPTYAAGETIFVETEFQPTTVAVQACRTNDRQWPVSLPFTTLAGRIAADVITTAEATLDNHVIGLRTVDELAVPALPLAILSVAAPQASLISSTSSRSERPSKNQPQNDTAKPATPMPSWVRDIEQRRGSDLFSFDPTSGRVSEGSDGIPEIRLRTSSAAGGVSDGNAFFLTLQGDLTVSDLQRQILEGWSARDLEPLGGELLLRHGPLTLAGLRGVDSGSMGESLRSMIGQPRVCLLYDQADTAANSPVAQLHCVGFVAGRVMTVTEVSAGTIEMVFQPTVMTSRSVVVAEEEDVSEVPKNRYLYKLRLTN